MSDASVKEVKIEPHLVRGFGSGSLCIGIMTGQLLIYDVSFGNGSNDDMIRVKPIDGEDVINVKKEHTKVNIVFNL